MKKNILFSGLLLTVTVMSCNTSDYSSKDDTNMNADTATISKDTAMNRLHPDTAAAVKITNVTMAKPNPSKKGMKVKVMVTLPVMGEGAMVADKEGYYTNTEVLPGYPGGQKELERFFEKNLQYPADAEDNGIEGTVKLNFAVDENGKIYSPVVTTPNIGYGVEQEAIRVFNKMPAWTPGRIKGKNVKTRFTLPVTFKLI
jgi:TonB family protein